MCASVAGVPAGKLASWATKVTVPAPVTAPLASRGTLNVMVTVPRALASALVIGGTSLAALSVAVKVIGPVLPDDGVVGLSLPHAAAISSAAPIAAHRFIVPPPRSLVVPPPIGCAGRRPVLTRRALPLPAAGTTVGSRPAHPRFLDQGRRGFDG